MSEYNRQRTQIQNQLESLRLQSRQDAQTYRQGLESLRAAYEQSTRAANDRIRQNHEQELRRISAEYEAHKAEIIRVISQQREEIDRRLQEERLQLHQEMSRLERRIENQLAQEKATADQYTGQMQSAWSVLQADSDLTIYIAPHVPVLETTLNAAREAYELAQYQAVTAIMINLRALIFCWEQEARALWEEWNALRELCAGITACIRTALDTACSQSVECDGKTTRVDLRRYLPREFEEMHGRLQKHEETLASASNLTIDQMRAFLHELQADQQASEALIRRAVLLHRAHLRRLQSLKVLTTGLNQRQYQRERCLPIDESLNTGIRALYRHEFQKARLIVLITTPDPENGRTEISVKLLPGEAMDEQMQYSLCRELSTFASLLLDQQKNRPLNVAGGNAYRDSSGLYQSSVTVQHVI